MRSAIIGICVLGAATGIAHAQTLSLNLPDAFAPVKAKLAAGQTGRIVVIGDSLAYREGTWLPEYRGHMQSQYGDAGLGFMDFAWWSGGVFQSGWTFGLIGQDIVPHRSLTGMWSQSPASSGYATYAAGAAKSLTLMIAGEPGTGTVTIQPPGGLPVSLAGESPTNQLRTASVINPSGLGTVVCTTSGGPVTLLGVVLESTIPGAFIHRVANGGWGVNNYLQRDWTFDAQLTSLAPDLVYIWLGQNDQGASQSVYESKMSQLVDRVQADAPEAKIVLVGTWNAGGTAIPVLVAAMQSVATQRGLGFINIFAAGGTYELYWSRGYLDGWHFSPAGGVYVGQMMFDAFQTDGADFCDVHFITQPEPRTLYPGTAATFQVLACAGTNEAYRWRRNGQDLSDDGRISGSGTPTLSFSAVLATDDGVYDVLVTGPCGSAPSQPALLTINPFCLSDFLHDGFVTGEDFDAFVEAFVWGDAGADINADTFVSGEDFDQFMAAFEAGC